MAKQKLQSGMTVRLITGAILVDIGPHNGRRVFWEGSLQTPANHPRLASRDPRKIGGRYPFTPTAVELAARPAEFEALQLVEKLKRIR